MNLLEEGYCNWLVEVMRDEDVREALIGVITKRSEDILRLSKMNDNYSVLIFIFTHK
jgi:hypothetical protein